MHIRFETREKIDKRLMTSVNINLPSTEAPQTGDQVEYSVKFPEGVIKTVNATVSKRTFKMNGRPTITLHLVNISVFSEHVKNAVFPLDITEGENCTDGDSLPRASRN